MSAPAERDTLLIVGGGRMGEALLAGLLAAGRPAADLAVLEVSAPRRQELAAAYPGVAVLDAAAPAAAAVVAVKPGDGADAGRAVSAVGGGRGVSGAAGGAAPGEGGGGGA